MKRKRPVAASVNLVLGLLQKNLVSTETNQIHKVKIFRKIFASLKLKV